MQDNIVQSFVDELLEERLIAALGTIEPGSKIHVVPMWFRRQDGRILLPSSSRSRKARNIAHHPHVSVMIHRARSAIEVQGILIRGGAVRSRRQHTGTG